MKQIPSIGRIVVVTLKNGCGELVERPGMIVRVWPGATPEAVSNCVQAQVFMDGSTADPHANDQMPNVVWKCSLLHNEFGGVENSWRWPGPIFKPVHA